MSTIALVQGIVKCDGQPLLRFDNSAQAGHYLNRAGYNYNRTAAGVHMFERGSAHVAAKRMPPYRGMPRVNAA